MSEVLKPQNILVIGGGGREDALVWLLRQSPDVGNIYVAPGNGGTAIHRDTSNLNINPNEIERLKEAALDLSIDLAVVGPEEPLVKGLVDVFLDKSIPAFGPKKTEAWLEGDKAAAVRFMDRYNIPHPRTAIFSDFDSAWQFLTFDPPDWLKDGIVVKASGLCGGKGVSVCEKKEEAIEALESMMVKEIFGDAGKIVLIQEKLRGYEMSVMAIVDGEKYLLLPTSEDHKQVYDEDHGPNTGGMGVVAPHLLFTNELREKIIKKILEPTVRGMVVDGNKFRGALYPGLMIVEGEPYVLEYNVRFGDPETEAVMPLLSKNLDFFRVLRQVSSRGLLFSGDYPVKKESCVTVTLSSGGYPGPYEKGKVIYGLDKIENAKDVLVFHAGTRQASPNKFESSGGRVLMVCGVGKNLDEAREKAYGVIGPYGIHFEGMHYRSDIGKRKRNL